MRFRLTAFALHLSASVCALSLVLGCLYLGWYRWPGWYLTEVVHVIAIVAMVDLGLGPTLTLIVADPRKPRRVLARDIAAIATVQLAALVYGATTLWWGRPLYYAFSVDRLELVQANDLQAAEISLARIQNPTLAPRWYSLPRWIWAPLPDDPQQASKIVHSAVFGGQDVVQMPRYFRSWNRGLQELRKQLRAVDDLRYFSRTEKAALKTHMARLRLAVDQPNCLILWGGSRRVLVVFDTRTLRMAATLRP